MDCPHESDLAPYFGDLSQTEKLSDVKPPLNWNQQENYRKIIFLVIQVWYTYNPHFLQQVRFAVARAHASDKIDVKSLLTFRKLRVWCSKDFRLTAELK